MSDAASNTANTMVSSTTNTLETNLQQLSDAVGVSGGESEVRKLILTQLAGRVSDITIDPMGNVTAIRKGTGDSTLRVMLSAHMDESGFMVSSISDDGLIHVQPVGALDNRYLPTQRVWVGDAKMPGVLLWPPIHKSQNQDMLDADDIAIDVGADDKGGVKAKPGERVAFAAHYGVLNGSIVRGKAFDSRAACAALLEMLDGDPFPFDLGIAFTVQAAIGGRGAGVAAHRLNPQVALSLTGFATNDWPHDPDYDHAAPLRLGGGPIIMAADNRLIAERWLIDHLRSTAQTASIAYQFDARQERAAASAAIGFAREGVPSVAIGAPVRYLGSPNALLDLTDLHHLVALVRASLAALTPELLETQR